MKLEKAVLVLTAVLILSCGIQAVRAEIGSVNFVGPYYHGYDPFYGIDVVAYKANANVTVAVSVYNNFYYSQTVNISSVKIWFDWGTNYTSSEVSDASRFKLIQYQSQVFQIKLTLPSDVSNQVTHNYKVYAEYWGPSYGNSSIGVLNTWIYQGSNFVVYSGDQAIAQDLYLELATVGLVQTGSYYYYYPSILNFPYIPFVSSNARMLWSQARNTATAGYLSYARGNFSDAKSSYLAALDLVNQSFDAESGVGANYEGSFINFTNGAANAMNGMGSSTLILAWGLGVGAVLFGLGILVYGIGRLRTGKQNPPPQ